MNCGKTKTLQESCKDKQGEHRVVVQTQVVGSRNVHCSQTSEDWFSLTLKVLLKRCVRMTYLPRRVLNRHNTNGHAVTMSWKSLNKKGFEKKAKMKKRKNRKEKKGKNEELPFEEAVWRLLSQEQGVRSGSKHCTHCDVTTLCSGKRQVPIAVFNICWASNAKAVSQLQHLCPVFSTSSGRIWMYKGRVQESAGWEEIRVRIFDTN